MLRQSTLCSRRFDVQPSLMSPGQARDSEQEQTVPGQPSKTGKKFKH